MCSNRRKSILVGIMMIIATGAWAQSPSIFYSDLVSGPNTGGQNSKGAFVTVYGKGFGATRGTSTVTIGGGAADNYPVWSDTKIAFQLGANAKTGNIVVNGSGTSNGVPFTVRAGNIYFVSTSGSDSSAGSYTSPWKTIPHAKGAMKAGDITYVMAGVSQTSTDDYNASLAIESAGTAASPIALVTYPGASVTIGSATGAEFAVRTPSISGGPFAHWVLAGFILRGGNECLDLTNTNDWRIIGNDMSSPKGDGPTACVEVSDSSSNIHLLGNYIHDNSPVGASKLYHSVYFSTNTNNVEAGWNTIANNHSCRGIQFHSTSGNNQYGLSVHDNVIHGQVCDGINFATVDPSKGAIVAYNNVIYDVGLGPDPYDGSSNYACIASPGITNAGSPGTGTVDVYNNTMYNCGSRGGSSAGAISWSSGSPNFRYRNNLIYANSGEAYITSDSNTSGLSGSNNLCYGVGACPSSIASSSISSNPLVANATGHDFHLQATSPAIDKGVTISGLTTDLDGVTRPQGAAFDIGAYEYNKGTTVQKPAAPTNPVATPH